MGDEEKDKVTTHAPQILLAAIFDEQRTDTISESKTEGGEALVNMEQQPIGEETSASVEPGGEEGSFRDSLELAPDRQSFDENDAKEELADEVRQADEPENLIILSGTSDKSADAKVIGVKSSPKRVSAKRGAVFINKNKENVRQPISRTYAAMHRAKVKEKQWKETKKQMEISKEREERYWTQNPEGLADSFESTNITASNGSEAYDSTNSDLLNNRPRDWYENDLQSISHRGEAMYYPYQTRYSDLNANRYRGDVQQPETYQQHNHMGFYGRTYNSAVHYPGRSHLPTLQHTFASQSAPSGLYSHLRRPLVNQVDCLPEEENNLSSTVPNSEFLDTQDQATRVPDSRLRRRFVSEPCLPHSDSLHLERDVKMEKTGYGASSRQTVTYKPYTLRDYRRVREVGSTSFGGLGPNTETSEYKERIQKVGKQKEYAEMLRAQHAGSKKQRQKNPQAPAQVKQGEAKRQAALNYAKSVPKPKKVNSQRVKPSAADQQREENRPMHDLTLTEILRMRHEKEKNEVDAIRRELASKIRL